jgi:hypothetical protein
MLLEEYIDDQITALKELFLWKYLSDEEKESLRQAPNEAKANILMHTFRDKYYDQMINDYEYSPEEEYLDVPLEELELKTKTLYALLRYKITTSGEFVQFVQEYGWKSIPSFGCGCAKDIYTNIYDEMSEDEIDKLVKSTKYIKNKGE